MNRLGTTICMIGLLLPTACGEGQDLSQAEAQHWLPRATPDLEKVIGLLRTCQPRRPSDYHVIWVEGEGGSEVADCSLGKDAALGELKQTMKKAGVIGVDYWPSGSAEPPVPWAEFILFRDGIATSGSLTSVIYRAEPQPCSEEREGSDGFSVVTKPLTGPPCHWFWRRSAN